MEELSNSTDFFQHLAEKHTTYLPSVNFCICLRMNAEGSILHTIEKNRLYFKPRWKCPRRFRLRLKVDDNARLLTRSGCCLRVSSLLNYNDTPGSVGKDRDLLVMAPWPNTALTQYRSHFPEGSQTYSVVGGDVHLGHPNLQQHLTQY